MSRILISVLLGLCSFAFAEDEDLWEKHKDEVTTICKKYIAKVVSSKEQKAWRKKVEDTVQQRVKDAGTDEESALQSYGFDWAADNRAKLESKDEQCIKKACMLFVYFKEKNYSPPGQMRERLTDENVRELVSFLEDLIAAKEGVDKNPPKTPKTEEIKNEK